MKTDDRDERLASILDEAVRDIDAFSREAPVAQSHGIGRAGRVVAAVAAAAISVGAVVFASGQFGRDSRPGAGSDGTVVEGTLATDGWQLERPDDWFTAPFDGCGTKLARGLVVSNVEFEFLDPQGEIPSCNERMVFAGFPSDGVAIDVEPEGVRSGVSPFPNSDTPFPMQPGQLVETDGIRGGPQHAMSSVVIGGEPTAIIRLWVGSDASTEDIEDGHELLRSLRVEGSDRWIEEDVEFSGWPVGKDMTVRVGLSRPEDWQAATYRRARAIDIPNPIVALASPPNDGRPRRICGPVGFVVPGKLPVPGQGVRLASNAVAIMVSDATDSWSYPKLGSRWAPLDPEAATTNKVVECGGGGSFRWLQWGFAIERRPIVVDLLMGKAVQDDVAALAWTTLDSLRFPEMSEPDEPAELPPPARDHNLSEFVSNERGYRFWPLSGAAERGLVYRFEVPHCGLDWLVDFDGSFWQGVIVDASPPWISAFEVPDGDVGTIELLSRGEARYTSSTGKWILLTRIDGPVVRQLCR